MMVWTGERTYTSELPGQKVHAKVMLYTRINERNVSMRSVVKYTAEYFNYITSNVKFITAGFVTLKPHTIVAKHFAQDITLWP